MRVTNSMMITRTMRGQNNNLNRMNKWNHDLTTMTNLHRPSDNPVKVARTLRLESDINLNIQYRDNADAAKSWLEKTESAMIEITSVVQRIRELAVAGANGVLEGDDTQKIEQEVKELRDHLIQIGNDTYMGRHIFSGYKTNEPLLDNNGEYNTNLITIPFTLLQLNNEVIKYQVGDSQFVDVNIPGTRVFGIEGTDPDFEPKLLKDIQDLMKALNTGDHAAASASIEKMDENLRTVLQVRGEVGAKVNMLDTMQERMADVTINLKDLLSKTRDTDIAETMIQLTSSEAVYRASLAVNARIIQPTLIDFLR